jgi:glycerophosphoryl diester phosphodiesterase
MQIFAHRGAAGRNADENSLEAIKRAVALGVDGIEVDLRLTRDGEAVLVHDSDMSRIAGDIRRVADLSLDELKAITLRHGTQAVTLDEM